MLGRKILFLEVIFGIYFLTQTLLPDQFTRLSSFIGFILLSFNKYYFEGFRANYLIFALLQLILLLINSIYLSIPVAVLVYYTITYFPIFKYPTPTGPYRVGYKMIRVETPKGATSVGVYYPTNQRTRDVKYSPSHKAWERFADLIRFYAAYSNRRLMPKFLFKMGLSFLEHQYLGVNQDAEIVKPEGNGRGFPVAVFSHGLSANIHLYSVILKEWASHGIIAFSVDHEEEIHLETSEFKAYPDYLKQRNIQLEARKAAVRKVLKLVSDIKYIQNLFGDQNVVINYKKVFTAGHSFGGATAAEVASEDNNVTGGVVLLDPWFECTNDKILYKRTDKPVLSVRSGFFNRAAGLKGMILRHVNSSSPREGSNVSGFFKNSGHNSSTDLMLLLPREMSLFGRTSNLNEIEAQLMGHTMLTRVFLKVVEGVETDKEAGDIKKVVLERYRNQIKELGEEDLFCDD